MTLIKAAIAFCVARRAHKAASEYAQTGAPDQDAALELEDRARRRSDDARKALCDAAERLNERASDISRDATNTADDLLLIVEGQQSANTAYAVNKMRGAAELLGQLAALGEGP